MLLGRHLSSLSVNNARARKVALVMAGAAMLGLSATQTAAASETMVFWDFNVPGESGSNFGTTVPVIDLTGNADVRLIGGVIGAQFGNGFVTGGNFTSISFPNNQSSDPLPRDDNSAIMATQYPAQGTGNKTAGFEFSFNTLEYTGISLRFDMQVQSSASRYQQLQYSVNGGEFVDFALIDVVEAWFEQEDDYALQSNHWILDYFFDFGDLLDHAATVDLRLVTQFAPGEDIYITNFGLDNYDTTLGRPGQIRLDMVYIEGTFAPNPFILGDINFDGVVDDADLLVLQSNLGLTNASWLDGDFSGNGVVDLYDAYLLFMNYEPPVSVMMVVPEPATALSMLLGGLLVIGGRSRRVESRPPLQNGAFSE